MDLVVDANVLFAVLIKDGGSARLLLHDKIQLFAPEFILDELEKYDKLIQKKTHRNEGELRLILSIIKDKICFIPLNEIIDVFAEAESISPDINDSPYFAVSLLIGAPLWTNDKRLGHQDRIRVYSTNDLIWIFPE